ncbi:tetratricopeptide repeat protein [Anaeramoeba flamelloides]|uniref:Tetratricopeptide repeat protein n=1 Tax=Anaeramoeba flamelloides TaxID=1746091 RepID=A0AAV7YEL7_9EUKA|nr:tetratricopeptide repeat protein [Anaeramoeba flamelloides]
MSFDILSYLLGKADLYYDLRNYKSAIDFYSQTLLIEPQNLHCLVQRGFSYYFNCNFLQAIRDLKYVFKLKNKQLKIKEKRKEKEKEEKQEQQNQKIENEKEKENQNKNENKNQKQTQNKNEKEIEKETEIENRQISTILGLSNYESKFYNSAFKIFSFLLKQDPNNYTIRILRFRCAYKTNNKEACVKDLKIIDPQLYPRFYLALIKYHLSLNEFEKVEQHLNQFFSILLKQVHLPVNLKNKFFISIDQDQGYSNGSNLKSGSKIIIEDLTESSLENKSIQGEGIEKENENENENKKKNQKKGNENENENQNTEAKQNEKEKEKETEIKQKKKKKRLNKKNEGSGKAVEQKIKQKEKETDQELIKSLNIIDFCECLYLYSKYFLKTQNLKESTKYIRDALLIRPTNFQYLTQMSKALFQQKQYDRLLLILSLNNLNSLNFYQQIKLYNLRIESLIELNNFEKIILECTEIINIIETNLPKIFDNKAKANGKGMEKKNEKKRQKKIKENQIFEKIREYQFRFYYVREQNYRILEQYEEALKDANFLIKHNPQNEHYYKERYSIYFKQNKLREAIKDMSSMLKIKPDESKMYFIRAMLQSLIGDFSEAIRDFKKCEQSFFTNIKYFIWKSCAEIMEKQFQTAKATIKSGTKLLFEEENYSNGTLSLLSGLDAYIDGKVSIAEKKFIEACEYSDDQFLFFAYYFRAELFRAKNDLTNAIQYYELTLQTNPSFLFLKSFVIQLKKRI